MGDWTSAAATIHACLPHRVRRVLDAMYEYGLVNEDTMNEKTLNTGEWHCADEFQCGNAADLADELIKYTPDVAFTVYEEPAYEWVGTFCSYVPDLGLFTADCDGDGEPMFARTDILRWDGEPVEDRQKQLGVPWLTAIAAMPAGTVAEPASFATHWNRRHGEVVVVEGKQCGGDLIFPAPAIDTVAAVEQALAERGFQRAADWTQLDETSQLWRTDVYRSPAP